MSDITENQPNLDQRPDTRITHDKDDSLDAEISLLESTLTELKEDEHQSDGHKKLIKTFDNISEVDLTDVSKENKLTDSSCNKPLVKFSHTSNKINPFSLSKFSSDESNINISSTTQHFKSTDNFSLMNSVVTIEYPDQQVNNMSSSPNCENVNFPMKACKEKILNTMQEGINNDNSEIVVSQCDSSFENCKEINNKLENNSNTVTISDGSTDKKDSEYFVTSNSVNIDGTDILNLECSPIHSPRSQHVEPESKLEVQDTFIASENKNSVICPKSEHPPSFDDNKNVDKISSLIQSKECTSHGQVILCKSPLKNEDCVGLSDKCYKVDIGNKCEMIPSTQTKTTSQPKTDVELSFHAGDDEDLMECKTCPDKDTSEANILKEQPPNIFSSTPIAPKFGNDNGQNCLLNTSCTKSKTNRKRKNLGLECIEEVDEDDPDICEEKKLKLTDLTKDYSEYQGADDQDISSSMPCFETPAKSILKKWQPSYLTRNSGSASFQVDECAGNDIEESTKTSQDVELAGTDDFEVACKSLTEELMKSSSNIETLEKYHSLVQLENQMDDEKFDEVLQELTLNYELDDKTDMSLNIKDTTVLSESINTISLKPIENSTATREEDEKSLQNTSTEVNTTVIEVSNLISSRPDSSKENNSSRPKDTILQESDINNGIAENITIKTLSEKTKEEPVPGTSVKGEIPDSGGARYVAQQISNKDKHSIIYADGKDMTMDEEDFLLEEDISARKKPYVFFEFVSNDPKENEDNYNPEWQKLRQLTSDEERYKAVRDRWRSLVPPDPNRDLTCRQWRRKNNKPPLNFRSLNNNHHMNVDDDKNQLCTAVFEMKIKKMVQDFEDSRYKIFKARNHDFEQLAIVQDKEQMMLTSRGASDLEFSILQKVHIEQCRNLKDRHDLELKRVTGITEEKIRILKEASKEVMLFQKFYKGVGADDDEVCMYMSDTQVQELMETEEMLEQYTKFYKDN